MSEGLRLQTELRCKLSVSGTSVGQPSWEGGKDKSSSDTIPGGFPTCSTHAASACNVSVPREASGDNFGTYSTDAAFVFSNTAVGAGSTETPRTPYAILIPSLEPGVLGSAGAAADKHHRSGALAWCYSLVCCADGLSVLWHAACLLAALHCCQGAHREWPQFSSLFSAEDASDFS